MVTMWHSNLSESGVENPGNVCRLVPCFRSSLMIQVYSYISINTEPALDLLVTTIV